MSIVREYVKYSLDDEERILIINGHKKLEETGLVGNEPIRIHTMSMFDQNNIPTTNIIMWMNMLAFECHRYFSNEYMDLINEKHMFSQEKM